MRIDREKLELFIRDNQINEAADRKKLTTKQLADKLADWIEKDPTVIDCNARQKRGRYYYSTVGYGVFSLLGERYRMGRIEIFDKNDESGYQISEGTYCLPFEAARLFEDWIEGIETDYPMCIDMGSMDWCQQSVSEDLGIPVDKLNDMETKKAFYLRKNEEWAKSEGYKDWDDFLEKSKFGKKGI
jgi:hypothetical protein